MEGKDSWPISSVISESVDQLVPRHVQDLQINCAVKDVQRQVLQLVLRYVPDLQSARAVEDVHVQDLQINYSHRPSENIGQDWSGKVEKLSKSIEVRTKGHKKD